MQWQGQKVLITGGTGVIGRALAKRLTSEGAVVRAFGSKECDLTRSVAVFESDRFDLIYHLATYQGAGRFVEKHGVEQYFWNSRMHLNVLDAWKTLQPQARLISLGSSCEYPASNDKLSEAHFSSGALDKFIEPYAISKRLLYSGQKSICRQLGLKGSHLIPATVFGPEVDLHPERAHFVNALLARIGDATLFDKPTIEVWGDGTASRELIFLGDQVDAILAATAAGDFELLNIGSSQTYTVREVVDTLVRAWGYQGEVRYNKTAGVGVDYKCLDNSKFRNLASWAPKTSLLDGLTQAVHWYRQRHSRQ